MNARVDETNARAYVERSARGVIGDLRLLQQVADGDYDGGSGEMLESLGLEIDDGCVEVHEAIDTLYAMPLAVEATTTFEVILGIGGPDRPLCFECDGGPADWQPDPHTPPPTVYEVRRVYFRYSWEGSAELELTGEDREIAEAFGRRVVPELVE